MRLIVLLSGWAGSGKDAAAALLVDELNFYREAFADSLKEDCSAQTGIPLEYFHSAAMKDEPLRQKIATYPDARTYRDVLLTHALALRAMDPDCFTRHTIRRIEDGGDGENQRTVLSDWRYKREVELLRQAFPDANILTVRIVRSSVTPSTDPSEHELDDATFDATIVNDGSISDLRDDLRNALRHLLRYHLS